MAIAGFLRDTAAWRGPRRYRLVPTRANGQPALGFYLKDEHEPVFRGHGMIVLTLEGARIAAITRFIGNGMMEWAGIPQTLDL